MINKINDDAVKRMKKSIDSLGLVLSKLRTGRAHTSLLDHITVRYFGSEVPLSQVASVTATDARTLTVQPWEKDLVSVVEKAIVSSDLGLNPNTAGTVIRVPLPALTEERRKDMIRIVRHEGENARVAIRNIRRDANNEFKSLHKEKKITEDELRKAEESMQKITDRHAHEIDGMIGVKEQDLMDI